MSTHFSSLLKWRGSGMYVPSYQNNGDKHWIYAGVESHDPSSRYFKTKQDWGDEISEVQVWGDEGFETLIYRPRQLQPPIEDYETYFGHISAK